MVTRASWQTLFSFLGNVGGFQQKGDPFYDSSKERKCLSVQRSWKVSPGFSSKWDKTLKVKSLSSISRSVQLNESSCVEFPDQWEVNLRLMAQPSTNEQKLSASLTTSHSWIQQHIFSDIKSLRSLHCTAITGLIDRVTQMSIVKIWCRVHFLRGGVYSYLPIDSLIHWFAC